MVNEQEDRQINDRQIGLEAGNIYTREFGIKLDKMVYQSVRYDIALNNLKKVEGGNYYIDKIQQAKTETLQQISQGLL